MLPALVSWLSALEHPPQCTNPRRLWLQARHDLGHQNHKVCQPNLLYGSEEAMCENRYEDPNQIHFHYYASTIFPKKGNVCVQDPAEMLGEVIQCCPKHRGRREYCSHITLCGLIAKPEVSAFAADTLEADITSEETRFLFLGSRSELSTPAALSLPGDAYTFRSVTITIR